MTPTRNTLRRMGMALAIAYLVVLQAFIGGIATGAHAGGMAAADTFGQVLCLSTVRAPASPADPAHHTPDCCTTGCQTSAGTGTALPPVALTPAVPSSFREIAATPLRVAAPVHGVERSPRHTRAPPLA